MKSLYCGVCQDDSIHRRYDSHYRCMTCDSPNYLISEIDNSGEHLMEMKKLKNQLDKLVVETGVPF